MKIKIKALIIPGKKSGVVLASILSIFLFNFTLSHEENLINDFVEDKSSAFHASVMRLNKTAYDFRYGLVSRDTLRSVFQQTRLTYKRIEFIIEYYYPSFAEEYLNGAPLLHIEKQDGEAHVLPPEGLQVLDEMVFSDSAEAWKVEIANLCQKLFNETSVLSEGMKNLSVHDADALEAIRQELVRMFALGLTGFDTPGSVNALAESREVMITVKEALRPFLARLEPTPALAIENSLSKGIKQLETGVTFDDFDRLAFLREVINPLYADLLLLKSKFGASSTQYSGLNPQGVSIFSDDFLDPYFYTQLKKNEDSPALRSLGEKLFFDAGISGNGKMSCASCHDPRLAFTDGKVTSVSNVAGQNLLRNSPTLMNAVYADRYFYDLRAFTLEQQAEHVIFNQDEFNTAYESILSKLNASSEYRSLFRTALGVKEIKRENFSAALTSFVLSLRSFNSAFDRYARGETDTLNEEAILGFNLFMGKAACATCHFVPTFSGLVPPRFVKNESEILGVTENPMAWKKELDKDMGRHANGIHSERAWIFERSFKTTTIRNAALTAPYFHNGAYPTLEAVVNFYNLGGGSGFGLEVQNQTLPSEPLNLTVEEKAALIAFMNALTDTGLN